MRNLEIDYPKTGVGIDFAPILSQIPTDPISSTKMEIKSASGRILNAQVGQNYLYLKDADRANDRYCLEAYVDRQRLLRFTLFTRLEPKPGGIQAPVHPDFFAGKFVGVALAHMQRFGNIDAIVSEWGEKSVGYAAFMQAYEKTGDKIGSAKKTWSWKTFSAHGFSAIRSIQIDQDPHWPNLVTTTFTRPS